MDPIQATLTGVLLPAVIAGLALAVGWRVWSRAPRGSGTAAGALAISLAYLAAYAAIVGTPASLWPGSARTPSGLDWLFWLTALFGLGFFFEARVTRRWLPLMWTVAGALLVEGVLRNTFRREWSGLTEAAWLLGLVALLLAPWWSLERLARKRPGASAALALWASAASLAAVAGVASHAQSLFSSQWNWHGRFPLRGSFRVPFPRSPRVSWNGTLHARGALPHTPRFLEASAPVASLVPVFLEQGEKRAPQDVCPTGP